MNFFWISAHFSALVWVLLGSLAAYLLGSVNFAVWVSRWCHLADPRSYGSGNPGATNVLRSGHRGAALATLAFDAAKGSVAVMVATYVHTHHAHVFPLIGVATIALAVFLGHVFPVFLGFRGGKGVATAAGVLLGLQALLGLFAGMAWLLTARLSGYSSLAAIVSSALTPLAYALIQSWLGRPVESEICLALIVMAFILLWRHQANMARLWAGTEPRIR
jgi:glycerol-3-phosphate acyltransferase PlsY